ncbi:MAG: TolC family protein [Candidatus Eisenbacteria bacterium]
MIAPLLVVMLAVAPSPTVAPAPVTDSTDSLAHPISLAEAVALAERNALVVIQAQGQRSNSRAAVTAAKAAFIPSVSLSAGTTRQVPERPGQTRVENGQVITLSSEPWSLNLGLGANVDLFTGGRRIFDLQQANAQAGAADVNLTAQRYAAELAAKQQFFLVLAAREAEEAAQTQLAQARQQLEISVLKLHERSVTRSDSLRSQITVHNARLALVQAVTARGVADAALTRAVGSDTPVTAAADDSLDRVGLALADTTLRTLALEGPAVREAEASLAAAQAALRGAWGAYLPSISAGYSRSGNGTAPSFDLSPEAMTYSGALRFSLTFPIFTQWQNEQHFTQARVARDEAVAALRDAKLGAVADFSQYFGAYHTAEERIATQIATIEAAEEDLRVQRDKYDIGTSTLLDVLTSQSTLDQARYALIQARYDLRVARAQLEALVGRDL